MAPLLLAAQIRGRVQDRESGAPLSGANVYLKSQGSGTVTDSDGWFRLAAKLTEAKDDTLIISYLGYIDFHQAVAKSHFPLLVRLQAKRLDLGQSIEVTGERENLTKQELPHLREAISAREVERYGSSELSDLVKKLPSVRIEGNDLDGRHVQIRGSNASEVNVYLDGILINSISADNSADLSIVPAEQIEQLEILKGGNLPLLGQGAFGGVVNILSRRSLKPELRLKSKWGSFDSRQYQASLQLPLFNNIYVGYFGQYHQMQPTIEYFPGERFSEKSKNDRIKTARLNHSINLDFYQPWGEIRSKYFNYSLQYDKPGWKDDKSTALWALSFKGANDFQFSLNKVHTSDQVQRYIVESTRYLSDYRANRLNLRVAKKLQFKSGRLQLVSDYYHEDLNSTTTLQNEDVRSTFYKSSLYDNRGGLAAVYSFEDAYDSLAQLSWRVYFGARGDFTAAGNRDFSNSWGARVTYKKNNREFTPYLSYGKNVKYPTLFQSAYVRDLVGFADTTKIHATLKPEYNNSYEIGTRYALFFASPFLQKIDIGAAYFMNITYNKILSRPFGQEIIQTQTGRNNTRGVEASVRSSWLRRSIFLTAAYTHLNIDNPLLYEYKPEENVTFQIEYVSHWGGYFSAMLFYEGNSYAWYLDTANEIQTDKVRGAWDGDISLGYRLKLWRLELDAQLAGYNIFDNSGYDYYYLKKRYLQASLSVKL